MWLPATRSAQNQVNQHGGGDLRAFPLAYVLLTSDGFLGRKRPVFVFVFVFFNRCGPWKVIHAPVDDSIPMNVWTT